MTVHYGTVADIESWMHLIEEISPHFPGLQTEEEKEDHRQTVLRFMGKNQALCVKDGSTVEQGYPNQKFILHP